LNTLKELEEAKKEIEELKKEKNASIYVMRYNDNGEMKVAYVGKDTST